MVVSGTTEDVAADEGKSDDEDESQSANCNVNCAASSLKYCILRATSSMTVTKAAKDFDSKIS
jgi:hypothetical protein